MRTAAGQVDLAGGYAEKAVDEMHHPVGQAAGEIGPVVAGAVLEDAPGYVDAGVLLASQLDVRVRLVVPQQDVEARLPALDQVVLERQRLLLVIDQDALDVARFRHQRPGLRIGQVVFREVAPHAVAEVDGLADVDDAPLGVLVEIDSGQRGQLADFLAEVHRRLGLSYTRIVARIGAFLLSSMLACGALLAQQKAPPPKPQEPVEEDETLVAKKEYAFNPLQAEKELQTGNFYFKKGSFKAAAGRFEEATKWNPGLAEAYFRLGEADEKLRDKKAAREAYAKFVELAPEDKRADGLRKKLGSKP